MHKINGKETFAKNWHRHVSKDALLDAIKISCTKAGTGSLGSGLLPREKLPVLHQLVQKNRRVKLGEGCGFP